MTETKQLSIRNIKIVNKNWSWMLAGGIAVLFFMIYMIINHVAPFGTRDFTFADSYLQYVPFLHELKHKMVSGESLFYTWNMTFGQDFYAVILYYLASPFNLLLYFVPEDAILSFFSFLIVSKISFSACAFGYYLSRREDEVKNNMFITIASLLYAFSGWSCVMFWNIMWLDGFMILPLIILGLERLVYKKDFRLYVIALVYAMCTNFYIGLIISIFLFIYLLILKHKDIDDFAFNFLRFFGYSVLAAIISAIVLIPVYYLSIKVSGGLSSASFLSFKSFLPFNILISNLFFNVGSNLFMYPNVAGLPSLYCGMIFILGFFIYLFDNTISVWMRFKRILLLLLLFISIDVIVLSYIFDGMHLANGIYSRFAFIFVFLAVVLIYDILSNIKAIGVKRLLLSMFLSLLLYGCVTLVMYHSENEVSFEYIGGFITIIVSILLICVYTYLYWLRSRLSEKKLFVCNIILCCLILSELFVNAWNFFNTEQSKVITADDRLPHVEFTKEATGFDVDMNSSSLFYRIISEKIIDDGLEFDTCFNIKSIDTFDSMLSINATKMAVDAGLYASQNIINSYGSNIMSNDMFGVRYIFVKNNTYLNDNFYSGYEKIAENDKYTVYENKNALSVAYCVSDDILKYKSDLMPFNFIYNDISNGFNIGSVFELVENTPNIIFKTQPEAWSYDYDEHLLICKDADLLTKDDEIIIQYNISENGYYYFDTNDISECNATVFVNDNIVFSKGIDDNNFFGYMGQYVDLGECKVGDKITVKLDILISTIGVGKNSRDIFVKNDIYFGLFKLNEDNLKQFRNKISKNQMVITRMDSNVLDGTIQVDDNEVIYTSIPYDESWDVYVDGVKLSKKDIIELDNGALCIKAAPGDHQIHMEFVPQGFYLGLMVSCCGILLYVILFVIKTRRLKQKKVE